MRVTHRQTDRAITIITLLPLLVRVGVCERSFKLLPGSIFFLSWRL